MRKMFQYILHAFSVFIFVIVGLLCLSALIFGVSKVFDFFSFSSVLSIITWFIYVNSSFLAMFAITILAISGTLANNPSQKNERIPLGAILQIIASLILFSSMVIIFLSCT